jgi:hypothetical protein
MATVTVVALGGVIWLRYSSGARTRPAAVGRVMAGLQLLDPETGEAVVLPGLRGKVVWVSFWSVARRSDLDDLERIWKRLRSHDRFVMAAVSIDSDRRETLKTTLAGSATTLPVYLAAPATVRALGAEGRSLPLHILIDETGRIFETSRDGASIEELADRVEERLEEIEPPPVKKKLARAGSSLIAFQAPR